MAFDAVFPWLLGAAAAGSSSWLGEFLRVLSGVALFLGVVVLPFVVGSFLARWTRMASHWWRIGLILFTLAAASVITWKGWPPSLGVDLKGGVILVYEVEEGLSSSNQAASGAAASGGAPSINMSDLVQAISRRINPSGTKEIVVRPYGDRQVEIIIPEADPIEIEQIKKTISTAGALEFRILANQHDHQGIIMLAREMAQDPARKMSRVVKDEKGEPVGFWAQVARETKPVRGIRPFKLDVTRAILRAAVCDPDSSQYSPGDIIDLPPNVQFDNKRNRLEDWLVERGVLEIDALMATNDHFNVKGDHLGAVFPGHDETMRPCVRFRMAGAGVPLFRALTSANLPDKQTGFYRRLGIILDGQLLSAPRLMSTISGSGQITGNFTQEEVNFLVGILRAGRLPATLNKTPISENQIGSMLGADTIRKGSWSIVWSLVCVLLFIAIYYRFSGVTACLALLANLLLIIAVMILVKAALTLPGLAGLVLTVGMSVDANVLIFERLREELARGAALRMAIRNGFGRATTTIVDADLTTLITALVLYAIGTDQIRGFAVTLILGILMSMYTAIFCSRVVFDIAERNRWITKLKMMSMVGATQYDFVSKRRIAVAGSIILILIGMIGVAARGRRIFAIDFTGGTSVDVLLNEPRPVDDVRRMLEEKLRDVRVGGSAVDYTLTTIDVEGLARGQVYKVDTSIPKVEDLKKILQEAFQSDGRSLLAVYSVKAGALRYTPPSSSKGRPAGPSPPAASGGSAGPASGQGASPASSRPAPKSASPKAASPGTAAEKSPSPEGGSPPPPAPPSTDSNDAPTKKTDDSPPTGAGAQTDLPPANWLALADSPPPASSADAAPNPPSAPSSPESAAAPQNDQSGGKEQVGWTTTLAFSHGINAETLKVELETAAEKLEIAKPLLTLKNPEWDGRSSKPYEKWTVTFVSTKSDVQRMIDYLEKDFSGRIVWPSSSIIGPKVAGDTQNLAIAALLTSLLGIVAYIWIRFQKVVFGLAAVVALVHDVLFTLGAIAVSYWLARGFGADWLAPLFALLKIDEFKINLPVVAAFLTIIGYSLNDTIVVFDRIREVRGRSPHVSGDMINLSINQTLSRTLLTSLTTLMVVVILYAFGGEEIHGFAFALLVGVFVGTYSSIFIASPILLWMLGARKSGKSKSMAA